MIDRKLKNMQSIKGGAIQMFTLLALWVAKPRRHFHQRAKEIHCDALNLCGEKIYKTPKPCAFELNRIRRYS